jgi:hypothetical protein
MTLTIDEFVTSYILSSHPRNKAIVDIKNKATGEICFIKIRHRLSKFYAVSLVDPVTFEVWAETQVKSATTRIKPIILHLDNKTDVSVEFRDSSRLGFEWTFAWEGEKYRWYVVSITIYNIVPYKYTYIRVRESRMSNSLECRAIRKTGKLPLLNLLFLLRPSYLGDICVAQYLPCMLKDEYFGIFSLFRYSMLRCNLTKPRELELIIVMSLMTLLDKSNDGGWKRDPISTGIQDDTLGYNTSCISQPENNNRIAYEDPIPKKALQKKYKAELSNEQKLQLMLERDARRSQKQIQSDHKHHKPSLSAGNSPAQSPIVSPLPTPSTSTHAATPRLARQKSASVLISSSQEASSSSILPSPSQSSGSPGRLSRLFSSLSHMKQTGEPSPTNSKTTSPVERHNKKPVVNDTSSNKTNQAVSQQRFLDPQQQQMHYQEKKQRKQQQLQLQQQQQQQAHPYYNHQLSLPTAGQISRLANEFGNLSIVNYDNPPSLRSIRWNQEPPSPIVTNNYIVQSSTAAPTYHKHRRNSTKSRTDDQKRMSASEYSLYAYHQPQQQLHYGNNYNYNNRYSTSEYYTYQQQQYDYYQ